VVLAGAAGGWAVALRPSFLGLLGVFAGAGLVLVTGGAVANITSLVTWGVAALGAAYMVGQFDRPVTVVMPAAFASLLLAIVELAWWSRELAATSSWSALAVRERTLALAAVLLGGLVVSVAAGLVGVEGLGAGSAVLAFGALCAMTLAVLVVVAVRGAASGRSDVLAMGDGREIGGGNNDGRHG
jgi:hypothetical protein